jgi:DNA-binding transcriptional regulator YiaG
MSYRQMEDQTGVSFRTICSSLDGSAGMWRTTWATLSAMKFEPGEDRALIDGTGTLRRISGLWHDGFPLPWLRDRFGVLSRPQLQKMLRGASAVTGVRSTTAATVARVYAELEGRKPEEFGIPVRTVRYCRTFAQKRGAAPRSCWDPDTIDDPQALPEWTGACGSPEGLRIHYRDQILPACPACLAAQAERETPAAGRLEGRGGISGKKLAAVRKQRGMSVSGLAARLGVHHGTVYYWETSRSAPRTKERIDQLITTLGCNYEDLKEDA